MTETAHPCPYNANTSFVLQSIDRTRQKERKRPGEASGLGGLEGSREYTESGGEKWGREIGKYSHQLTVLVL